MPTGRGDANFQMIWRIASKYFCSGRSMKCYHPQGPKACKNRELFYWTPVLKFQQPNFYSGVVLHRRRALRRKLVFVGTPPSPQHINKIALPVQKCLYGVQDVSKDVTCKFLISEIYHIVLFTLEIFSFNLDILINFTRKSHTFCPFFMHLKLFKELFSESGTKPCPSGRKTQPDQVKHLSNFPFSVQVLFGVGHSRFTMNIVEKPC